MNIALLRDRAFRETLVTDWRKWQRCAPRFPSVVEWWERVAKKRLRFLFMREGALKRRDEQMMEDFYYACMYDALLDTVGNTRRTEALNLLKAKIVRLNSRRMERVNLDVGDHTALLDERVSLFHLIRRRTRQERRTVTRIADLDGTHYEDTGEITRVFQRYLCAKYAPIVADHRAIRTLLGVHHRRLVPGGSEALRAPITMDELRLVLCTSRRDTAPGKDGIGLSFFKQTWDSLGGDLLVIFNQMFSERKVTAGQKEGVIVCIPKKARPLYPQDYRPITLLNTDYKTLARLIANRLSPVLGEILHPGQHCGVRGKTIFDAAGTVRDVIAYAEVTRKPICVVSLDFTEAFDRLSHDYLFAALADYGVVGHMLRLVRCMYSEASSAVQINAYLSARIPICCGVRQGCPMSMLLFDLCLDPLLCWLDDCLPGIMIRPGQRPVTAVAYADDVTVFLTAPEDVDALREALCLYERATGAKVNVTKSRALALGTWDKEWPVLDMPYCEDLPVLGFRMSAAIAPSMNMSWTRVVESVRLQSREAYTRDLLLSQRIQYAHSYLLARIWHTAQVFPLPRASAQRLMAAIACFLWQGEVFRVPISTLQRAKEEGGWGLLDVEAKCRAILFLRLWRQGQVDGSVVNAWHRYWRLRRYIANPPPCPVIPTKLAYLRQYASDLAYVDPPAPGERTRRYKQRIYNTLRIMRAAGSVICDMRIVTRNPAVVWSRVWKNLHMAWVSDLVKSVWFLVIHDVLPTNERLSKINLAETAACDRCGEVDTVLHRLTACSGGQAIWHITCRLLAMILRTAPTHIPPEWVLHPHFQIWPPTRHGAVLWLLAQLVWFRTKEHPTLSGQDYLDFLRRARWKADLRPGRQGQIGNYLRVLDS
jgi:hypothetical protein